MAAKRGLEALRQFSPCDIGDALVKLKYPLGGFLGGLKMYSPGGQHRIAGPAVTVKMVMLSNKDAPSPERHFADHCLPGAIMYIQQPPRSMYSACWSGLTSTRAKHLGAQGAIVNGKIRDVSEHNELGFPVFSRGTAILESSTLARASEIDVPVRFKGDLWINPGDLLVADHSGVVVTPPSLVDQVVALCEEKAEIDRKMLEGLRGGGSMSDLIKELQEQKDSPPSE
ncbi:putative ribonuclease e inhibitor rraa dimethylmenaquinone methyltransferase [Rosellinia necatrix]|uniref:Putative ribonuclease e inhibitor rraa dimethylmenaquinone methyltransferase n=1 Tax=Rosellinia necatrix TaxID=77044 RepID=A0A1S7UJC8_ROSNE|nr:putative ribonuclease e inhibitor rraa dimethylmenaquinone methyltransferase [Rosellinia necatrix]